MQNQTVTKDSWTKEFDELFADVEGCEKCGESFGKIENGHFVCKYCELWGGIQGKAKDFRKPLASCSDIKSFISSLLTHEREELRKAVEGMKDEPVNLDIYWKKAIKHRHEALKKLKLNTISAVLELLDKQK